MVALVLSLAAGAGLSQFDAILTRVFHAYAPIKDELFSVTFSTLWPSAGLFLSSLTRTLIYATVLGLTIIHIVRASWKLRAWWLWPALALVLVALGPPRAHSLAAYGVGWAMAFVPLAVAALLIGFFFRNNILAYLLAIFGSQVAEGLMDLFSQHNRFYLQNGVVLALLAGLVLAWALWPADENAKSV